jgi:hypothetical protein
MIVAVNVSAKSDAWSEMHSLGGPQPSGLLQHEGAWPLLTVVVPVLYSTCIVMRSACMRWEVRTVLCHKHYPKDGTAAKLWEVPCSTVTQACAGKVGVAVTTDAWH